MTGTTKAWLMEISVLLLVGVVDGFLGYRLLASRFHLIWPVLVGLVLLGGVFELLTRDLWTYPNPVFRYPFTKDDLSFSMPFAWAGYMTFSLGLALYAENAWFHSTSWPLGEMGSALYLVFPGSVIVFILGNCYETFFHKIGYFYYTDSFREKWGRALTPWGIPASVSFGYFWFFGLVVLNLARLLLYALN